MKAKKNMDKKIKNHFNEKWKAVDLPSPAKSKRRYFISNYGRIKYREESGGETLMNGGEIRGFKNLKIKLENGKTSNFYIHKFVAENFTKKNRSDRGKDKIIHKNGNKLNNKWDNLKWVTKEELLEHHRELGVFDRRAKKTRKRATMTEAKVRILKQQLQRGKTKKKILARNFGISYMQLNRIERGENWGHVQI